MLQYPGIILHVKFNSNELFYRWSCTTGFQGSASQNWSRVLVGGITYKYLVCTQSGWCLGTEKHSSANFFQFMQLILRGHGLDPASVLAASLVSSPLRWEGRLTFVFTTNCWPQHNYWRLHSALLLTSGLVLTTILCFTTDICITNELLMTIYYYFTTDLCVTYYWPLH